MMENTETRDEATPLQSTLFTSILALGVALRVAEFVHNKAIWLDEAYLALNILGRSFRGLVDKLEYGQGAPLPFLMAERVAANTFGPGEYALRLVPLLAGLASLALFAIYLRRTLNAQGTLLALAIFALSQPAIRYASEVKQYSTDVLTTIVLLIVLTPLLDERAQWWRYGTSAIVGAIAAWCAFPAVFILAGAGAVIGINQLKRRDFARAIAIGIISLCWIASFAGYYQLSLRALGSNVEVRGWWVDHFMPFPPHTPDQFNWFVRTFLDSFADPFGLPAFGIGAVGFILGVASMRKNAPWRSAFWLAPIGVALLASGAQMYPFTGRFLLFALPIVALIVAVGLDRMRTLATPHVFACVVAVLFVQPAIAGAKTLVQNDASDGIRPAFAYIKSHAQKGDALYVEHWAMFPFQYYEHRDGAIADVEHVYGAPSRDDWGYFFKELDGLRGRRRVWFVFVNSPKVLVGEEEKFFRAVLDNKGTRQDMFRSRDSNAYLYDLSTAQPFGKTGA